MGMYKKLLLIVVTLSLSACSAFEGKNTFMTYQDLQDQVKSNSTDIKAAQGKLDRIDQVEADVAELKKSNSDVVQNQPISSSVVSDNNTAEDGAPIAANVAPTVTENESSDADEYDYMSTSQVGYVPASQTRVPAEAPMIATAKAAEPEKVNNYGVQLASYSNRAEAVRGWKLLLNGSPDTYVNLEPHVNEKQVNGRTMYQLKVGPFIEKAYGVDFCNMLKQKGQDCLVNKYDGQPL